MSLATMRRAAVVAGVVVHALVGMMARAAAQVSPAAPEIAVNSHIDDAQRAPVSCRSAAGEVVAWQSDKQDGRGWGIYAQRYSPSGAPAGSEFRVHSHTSGNESHPAIACTDDGRFIITWDSDHAGPTRGVYGQLFDAQGIAIGSEIEVNSDTMSDSVLPAVCASADGTAVVAWQGYHPTDRHDIFAMRFTSTGERLGSEFRVNTHVESTQSRPAVGCHRDGDFVVVWDSDVQDGADFGIFGQRYDRDGTPHGFEFQVNSTTLGSQLRPHVAVAPANDFVVVWESRSQSLGSYGVFGQRFDANGPRGTEFRVGGTESGDQSRPSIATDAHGDFVVVWANEQTGGPICGQRYASGGQPVGPEFHVSANADASARSPSVAMSGPGDFTVAWQRREMVSGDDGIAARRFVVCGNGRVDPGESCDDGNLVDGDCCSSTCEFEQAPSLSGAAHMCANIDSSELVCSVEDSARVPCDDGSACTINDACQYGVCVGGPPPNCDDGNVCTTDSCRPQVGCLHAANSLPCDDGNACTGPDVCRSGTCRSGPTLSCDDANVCTDDSCDPASGCAHQPNSMPCSDGNACTTGDRCAQGVCVSGAETRCDDGDACTDDRCDPVDGCRHVASAASCDDGNPCTADTCSPQTGCVHTPIAAPCDDGNACTRVDTCEDGRCRGREPIVCAPIDACHAAGTCDPASGLCSSPSLPEGAPCDDGSICTVGDQCHGGQCMPGRTGLPFLVKDINTGVKGSAPVELVSAGGRVFFRAEDGEHGRELWVSDGTAAGTTLVADIRPGPGSSAPGALAAAGARVFFAATDARGDRELWVSDGSLAGTRRVRDIDPSGSGSPSLLVGTVDRVFFVADDGVNGRELWSSDGTESGTSMLRDIRPGRCGGAPCSGAITDLTATDGRLYFAADDGISGRELWSSDGSTAGTKMVADIRPGAAGSQPAYLTPYAGGVAFAADDGEHGKELWRSNGSAGSTIMIADIRPGECDGRPCSSSPSYLTESDGTLFFAVAHAPAELWRSDGTASGTRRIATVPSLPYVSQALHSSVLFASGAGVRTALWRSDGTSDGTVSLAAAGATAPAWPASMDGHIFFSGSDKRRGTELWSSDGTTAGTVFVQDINPNHDGDSGQSSSPASLTANGNMLFFSADDGAHGRELWALCR